MRSSHRVDILEWVAGKYLEADFRAGRSFGKREDASEYRVFCVAGDDNCSGFDSYGVFGLVEECPGMS